MTHGHGEVVRLLGDVERLPLQVEEVHLDALGVGGSHVLRPLDSGGV